MKDDRPMPPEVASHDGMFLKEFGYTFILFFLSEIGGKSFILIMIYATKIYWMTLLIIALVVLGGLHLLGILIGLIFQNVIPQFYLTLVAVVVFTVFGICLLYDGLTNFGEDEIVYRYPTTETSHSDMEEHLLPNRGVLPGARDSQVRRRRAKPK